jgi:drug/metabolite transporter (DMT)-like permease
MAGQVNIHREHRLAGQGAILLCAVLWSTSGLFIKLVSWNPLVIAGTRSVLAALFLLGLRFLRKQKTARGKDLFWLILGGFNNAGTMIFFVIANKLTASANAILLQYTSPVWAALLGWFLLRERPRWEHWGAMVMAGFGMTLFFRESLGGGALLGDCLALVSGFCFGTNSVIMRKLKDGNPADVMLLSHIICAALSLPFLFIYPPAPSAGNIIPIFFMGILQLGVTSVLFAYGIKRLPAVQALLTSTL